MLGYGFFDEQLIEIQKEKGKKLAEKVLDMFYKMDEESLNKINFSHIYNSLQKTRIHLEKKELPLRLINIYIESFNEALEQKLTPDNNWKKFYEESFQKNHFTAMLYCEIEEIPKKFPELNLPLVSTKPPEVGDSEEENNQLGMRMCR